MRYVLIDGLSARCAQWFRYYNALGQEDATGRSRTYWLERSVTEGSALRLYYRSASGFQRLLGPSRWKTNAGV